MLEPHPHAFLERAAVVLDSITDGVFAIDPDFRITAFNRAAEEITAVPRAEALGRPCCDVFHASICETACALRETLASGRPIQCRPIHIVRPDGRRVPLSISTALLKDGSGRVIGGVESFRDLSVIEDLRRELTRRHSFHDIVARSQPMQRLFDILPDVARSSATVLIEGPSGSGKELVAHAIHDLSPRAGGPLVVVNCGALPDSLLEPELFGHVRGAFTDATMDRKGRFALAGGGTILLDEIGDVSPALQVRLLRVLQEKTYEPVGSSQPQKADVRVIAATNKNLRDEVAAGRFREDLFYRINVVRLEVPPLSRRRSDIPLLAEHFIERLNRLHDRGITGLSDEALAALVRHDWPGNVRELENAIEHAFVLCRGPVIFPEHLPREIAGAPLVAEIAEAPIGRTLAEFEAQIILAALRRNNGRRTKTARELGINKSTLWRKMRKLGILAEPAP
ncbi:MAG: sigma 54-interacting transcriptional regulator [Planctomycetes bacterium]|nr:sigma 54-interacting transcriptional regulator [Planctomycetota bacterium]